jgi:repressor LexA
MLPKGTRRGIEQMQVRQGGVARPTKATAGSKRMKDMSLRQKQILQFIENFLARRGYPPTIREIQGHLKPAASGKPVSTSVVDYNLNILEERNLIRRNRHISRGIELVNPPHGAARATVAIPLVGQIAAGTPIPVPDDLAEGEFAENIEMPTDLVPQRGDLFALRVKGRSMIDEFINDGDIVILRQQVTAENGETVAVWLKEQKETTLKRFYQEGERVRLQPANVTMDPIFTPADNVEIQGKLVTVVRSNP